MEYGPMGLNKRGMKSLNSISSNQSGPVIGIIKLMPLIRMKAFIHAQQCHFFCSCLQSSCQLHFILRTQLPQWLYWSILHMLLMICRLGTNVGQSLSFMVKMNTIAKECEGSTALIRQSKQNSVDELEL